MRSCSGKSCRIKARRCEKAGTPLKFKLRHPGCRRGKGVEQVRNHLTRVVVPVVGLLAVTTALALVGIAPILLFPASKDAGPHSVAPSASSEVATVAAAGHANGGSRPTSAAESTGGPRAAGS